jgi:protein required for attachment to host cells
MRYWILIADAGRARIMSTPGGDGPLHQEEAIQNPRGRARAQDLMADQPGRYSSHGKGSVKSAMEYSTPPHKVEELKFAEKLAEMLEKSASNHKYDRLVMIAPPEFLGFLRKTIAESVHKRLVASIAKDLTEIDPRDLMGHMADVVLPLVD